MTIKMWHIAKRELYDNLNSLRFALATVLLLALMLTNAILYLREHPARTQAYHNAAAGAIKTLESRSTNLYSLATGDLGTFTNSPHRSASVQKAMRRFYRRAPAVRTTVAASRT